MLTKFAPPLAVALALVCAPSFASARDLKDTFTKADLEKMVKELSMYIPQSPNLQYPIICEIEKDDSDINAHAYATEPTTKGGKPVAHMGVITGFLVFLDKACKANTLVGVDPADPTRTIRLKDGDQMRLLRAVIAHEMGHLSKEHVIGPQYKPNDLKLVYIREKEYEADAVGAAALQRAGYSRQDFQDIMIAIDTLFANQPAAARLLGDHADGKRRAAAVASDPRVLRSLIEFDMGESFAEGRNYAMATRAYQRASQKEPRFVEAYINAAQSQLMYYYQELPAGLRDKWYSPDFGPLLSPFRRATRADTPTDADRARYAEAQRLATIAIQKAPADSRALEVVGLVGVLHPDGDAGAVASGIASLQKALGQTMDARDRLRVANNIAVGLGRQNEYVKAAETMMSAQRATDAYNAAVARNLGAKAYPASLAKDAPLASAVLFTFLKNSPSTSSGYQAVAAQYKALTEKYKIEKREYKAKAFDLAPILSLTDGRDELALFEKLPDVEAKLGAGEVTFGFPTSGDTEIVAGKAVGVFEKRYRGGNVLLLCQSAGDEAPTVLRITDYTPGAKLVLRAADPGSSQTFEISVGESRDEVAKLLNLDSIPKKQFVRVGRLEEWYYLADYHFGIAITDGKVSGITISPSK